MAPKETPDTVLVRAPIKRDCALKSIEGIHATALDARSDASKLPSLNIRAEDLDSFVSQFVQQQDIIINALIDLNRATEFNHVDRLVTTKMESLRFEIKTTVGSDTASCKSSSSTSTLTVPQQFVPLPKIKLNTFDGNLLSWRSFLDVYLSLVHDNTRDPCIGDAERFHYLLSCLSGPALATIKSIPFSANNYAIAWDALSERFDNKRLLASAHLDKLLSFKPIVHESLPALIEFVNVFNENVSIIKSLCVNDLSSFLLFHMGSRVLHSTTLQLFEASASQSTIPNFDELLNFVQHRCKILENLKNSKKYGRNDKPDVRGEQTKPTKSVFAATTSTSNNSRPRNCLCCDKPDHRIYQCPKLAGMNVDKRREIVLARKLCFACLSPTHMVNACQSTKVCSSCKSKRHNTLLHREQDDNTTQNTIPISQPTTSSGSSSPFVGAACTKSTVVLGTAIVHVKDVWDQVQYVRVLLDSGSQISAVTSECAARLGFSKRRYKSDIVGFAQSPISHVQGVTNCQFSSRFNPDYLFPSVELVILKQITAAMPSARLPASVRSRYQHLRLADNNFDIPSRVDVLFGADILPSLVRPHAGVEHHPGLPSALDTQLGWIVFGSFATLKPPPVTTLTTAVSPPSIGDLIQNFWSVEEPAAPPSPTTEDQWCEQHFQKSTSRDASGRFCVALPFHQEFQLCTVTYGLKCAPYLAIRCLHELDAQEGHRFPLAKGVLTQAAYVDDIVMGSDTEEQLLRRKCDIVNLLREGACELSKWTSNSALVLESLHPDDRIDSVSFDPQDEQSVKVLGLHWNTNSDSFAYHTSIQQTSSTKRQVLSVIARLFDPIGALGPLLLWAKCFMQSLWCSQLGWDDPLTDELLRSWHQFCLELADVFDLSIPRYIPVVCQRYIQLLGFTDASIKATRPLYICAVLTLQETYQLNLLRVKLKLPLSKVPLLIIPYLYRVWSCVGRYCWYRRCTMFTTSCRQISIARLRAWTDSSIVLSWLTSDQKYFKIFITNRVAKIHQLLPDCKWSHVSTAENPYSIFKQFLIGY